MLIAASGLTMVRFLAEFTLSQVRFLASRFARAARDRSLGMTEGRRARNDSCGTNGFDAGSQDPVRRRCRRLARASLHKKPGLGAPDAGREGNRLAPEAVARD